MRIIFFGTGKFGMPTLKAVLNSDHDLVAVITGADTKQGRGYNALPTPIKAFIEKAAPHIDVEQPLDLHETGFVDFLERKKADIFIVVDYGKFLPDNILGLPGKYCVNLHPSVLPKYRGAAPMNYSILKGDEVTGNTIFKMDRHMDAGPIILQEKVKIKESENVVKLAERMSSSGADLVLKALSLIENGQEKLQEQEEKEVTYAKKIKKQDGTINWEEPSQTILLKMRGLQPWPGVYSSLDGKLLKIFNASEVTGVSTDAIPGAIIDKEQFIVKTGDTAIAIETLQLEGKKKMSRLEFLRGYGLNQGTILGA
jgi:methionyl-tRNA formyltransferase